MIQHEAAAPMSVDVVDGSPTSTTVERDRAAEKHARTAAIGSLDELESACRAVATELTELTEGEAKTPESIIGLQNQRQNLYACLVVEIVWNDLTEEFHVPQSLSTACTAAVAELRAFQKKLAGRIQEYWSYLSLYPLRFPLDHTMQEYYVVCSRWARSAAPLVQGNPVHGKPLVRGSVGPR